jgi:hypothetical protein
MLGVTVHGGVSRNPLKSLTSEPTGHAAVHVVAGVGDLAGFPRLWPPLLYQKTYALLECSHNTIWDEICGVAFTPITTPIQVVFWCNQVSCKAQGGVRSAYLSGLLGRLNTQSNARY